MKFHLVFGLPMMVWLCSSTASGQDLPCSSSPATASPDQKITTSLCSELKTRNDTDFLPIMVYFKRPPAIPDTVDPKKDSSKEISRPSDTTTPPQYTEYTKQIFTTYDLRDLSDSSRRLSIPEKIAGNYLVLATKKTILEMNQAAYIMNISFWDSRPAGVGRMRIRESGRVNGGLFDLTGRRNPTSAHKYYLLLQHPRQVKNGAH